MQLALYQPDIPQNLGAFIRLSACLGTPLHIIEPCGFPLDERKIRRAAMDYYDKAQMIRHGGWEEFLRDTGFRIQGSEGGQQASRSEAETGEANPAMSPRSGAPCEKQNVSQRAQNKRIILLTTKAAVDYRTVEYQPSDILLLGRESAGVPNEIHDAADLRVMIPMAEGCRSLNVTLAAAIVLGFAKAGA